MKLLGNGLIKILLWSAYARSQALSQVTAAVKWSKISNIERFEPYRQGDHSLLCKPKPLIFCKTELEQNFAEALA